MNIFDMLREFPDIQKLVDMGSKVYPAKIPGKSITVTAGGTADDDIIVPINTHFLCTRITGRFTTLHNGGDDGVCRQLMKISDNGRSLPMYQDFCFLDLILSPGRRKNTAGAGDPTHQLFSPDEFVHMFKANSSIHFDFKSTATTDSNYIDLVLHGFKFKIPTVSGTPENSVSETIV